MPYTVASKAALTKVWYPRFPHCPLKDMPCLQHTGLWRAGRDSDVGADPVQHRVVSSYQILDQIVASNFFEVEVE